MTLRFRILLLFLCFTVLPVILLGAGDFVQSLGALKTVIDARGEGLAGQTAREVESAYAQARSELRTAAEHASLRPALPTPDEAVELLAGATQPFSELRLIQDDGVIWTRRLGPGTGRECVVSGTPLRVRVSVPGRPGLELEGRLAAGAFLAAVPSVDARLGPSGYTQLIDLDNGRILFDSSCGTVGQRADAELWRAAADLALGGSTGVVSRDYELNDRRWHASIAVSDGPDVGVVLHSSEDELVAPFRQSRLRYLATVLAILLIAAVAVVLRTQFEFRSLRSLTAAADQIELGNLRPWLPPPGDDEVGRLSLAFRRMIDRLSESIRQVELNQKLAAVGELASYLSHEIRNPLSSIRLSLQSLHRDLHAGFIPSDADRVIAIALNEVQRLDGVVRTVLEVGRQQGDVGQRTCAVHAAIEQTLDVIRPKVRAQGVELEFVPRADRDLVRGEAEALRGVCINLLVNALDALEGVRDPRVRISTWTGPAAAGELHVRVADNGPGIPPDIAESIFEPFFTTKPRGNGIGLPTALRTVQPWGGTITYEPVAAGSGAVFVVKLKLADPSAPADAPMHPQLETALPR